MRQLITSQYDSVYLGYSILLQIVGELAFLFQVWGEIFNRIFYNMVFFL